MGEVSVRIRLGLGGGVCYINKAGIRGRYLGEVRIMLGLGLR